MRSIPFLVTCIFFSTLVNAQQFIDQIAGSGLPSSNGDIWAVIDYDNDSLLDLVYGSGNPEQIDLYRNTGGLQFQLATAQSNLNYQRHSNGYSNTTNVMDIDNNGWDDIVEVASFGDSRYVLVYANHAGEFTLDTIELATSENGDYRLADMNRDGWIDIVVLTFPTGLAPSVRVYYNPANSNILETTWAFEDIITFPMDKDPRINLMDHDLDGDLDVFLLYRPANPLPPGNEYWYWPIKLFDNQNGTFVDITSTSGLDEGHSRFFTAFDFNNDGTMDILLGTNDCCESPLVNRLYQNNGNGTFTDVSTSNDLIGGNDYYFISNTGDLENDGDEDVAWFNTLPSEVYLNSSGSWVESASALGLSLNNGAGSDVKPELIDLDNDGDLDVFYSSGPAVNGVSYLMVNTLNDVSSTNHLELDLVGCSSGFSALNSTVIAYYEDQTLAKVNSSLGSGGNRTGRFHFGLGSATLVDSIEVHWSSGALTKHYGIAANQLIEIREDPNCILWNIELCDSWTQVPDFSGGARRAAFAVELDGKAYVGGGQGDGTTYLEDFYEYDPVTGSTVPLADLGFGKRARGVAFSANGKVYMGLGWDENFSTKKDIWEYDPSTDTWTQKNDFPGDQRTYPSNFTINDRVFVGMGFNGSTTKRDIWEYDAYNDTWTQRADYGGIPLDVASSFVIDDKAYVGVGQGSSPNNGYFNTFWQYDPLTDSWAQKADLPGPVRGSAIAFSLNGYGYLGTGGTSTNPPNSYKDLYRYDPGMDSWEQIGDFGGVERNVAFAFKLNGKVYAGCGGDATPVAYADMWEFCGFEAPEQMDSVVMDVQVFLQGPYELNKLMRDDIREAGDIPLHSPYPELFDPPLLAMQPEIVSPLSLADFGQHSLVDWLRVEFRPKNDSTKVIAAKDVLVKRNGTIVSSENGVFPVEMKLPQGEYHVAIRHRNHLGVMSQQTFSSALDTIKIDFRDPSTATYGVEAQKVFDQSTMMWSGNALPDTLLKYTGIDNDRDRILQAIGGSAPTNTITGYHFEDANMDGIVKYTGSENDRDILLQNIGGVVPTNVRAEELP